MHQALEYRVDSTFKQLRQLEGTFYIYEKKEPYVASKKLRVSRHKCLVLQSRAMKITVIIYIIMNCCLYVQDYIIGSSMLDQHAAAASLAQYMVAHANIDCRRQSWKKPEPTILLQCSTPHGLCFWVYYFIGRRLLEKIHNCLCLKRPFRNKKS